MPSLLRMPSHLLRLALALSLVLPHAAAQTVDVDPGGPATDRGTSRVKWTRTTAVVPSHIPQLRVTLNQGSGPLADLYLRKGTPPTVSAYDHASRAPGTGNEELVVGGLSSPALSTGVWHIGVRHEASTTFSKLALMAAEM